MERIEYYPDYDRDKKINDIAMIIMKSGSKIPIGDMTFWFTDKFFSRDNLTFYEWGIDKKLKTLNFKAITSGECTDLLDKILSEELTAEDGRFCAKSDCKCL